MQKSPVIFLSHICSLVFLFLLSACNKNVGPNNGSIATTPGSTKNKELVIKFYQALNESNWPVAESIVDTSYKHYFVKDTGFASIGWQSFKKNFQFSQKAFPDWKLTPVKMIAEGDHVYVLLSGKGTHKGDFAGMPASNNLVAAPISLLHQLKNGKLIADWEIMNAGALMEQLKKK